MQTFVPPSHGHLTSIGSVVTEEETFENVNTRHTDRQTTAMPYDKLTNEPSAQVS